jgi:hypothetical protein
MFANLRHLLIFVKISFFVLDRAPNLLNKDSVVQPPAEIPTDPNPPVFQNVQERRTCELGSLAGIEYLWH